MARPEKKRRIHYNLTCYYFKPRGVPIKELEEVEFADDELEAIRLADLEELFQEDAASKMNISRATFGRIIMRAHHKIADAIINGKAIKIAEGIPDSIKERSIQICKSCGRESCQLFHNNKCKKCLSNTKE